MTALQNWVVSLIILTGMFGVFSIATAYDFIHRDSFATTQLGLTNTYYQAKIDESNSKRFKEDYPNQTNVITGTCERTITVVCKRSLDGENMDSYRDYEGINYFKVGTNVYIDGFYYGGQMILTISYDTKNNIIGFMKEGFGLKSQISFKEGSELLLKAYSLYNECATKKTNQIFSERNGT